MTAELVDGTRPCVTCIHCRDEGYEDYKRWCARQAELTPKGFWQNFAAVFEGLQGVYRRFLSAGPPPPPKPMHCARTDRVTGQGNFLYSNSCFTERLLGECGREGMFYEPARPEHERPEMRFAVGPYRIQSHTEGLFCPWCGDDQIDNPGLENTIFENAPPEVDCTDCHRPFTFGHADNGDPATVGMITSADVRYIGQRLAKSY